MTTKWFFPNSISQFGEVEQHVPWGEEAFVNVKTDDANYLSTTHELLHIANPSVNNLKMKTYYLYVTDFRMTALPSIIAGIEVEVNMKRGGRITDETIQLRQQDEFIGENRANYLLDNVTLYGSPTDLWDIPIVDSVLLSDPSFGVGLRYQSHPSWPHREHPMINYVRIRVW